MNKQTKEILGKSVLAWLLLLILLLLGIVLRNIFFVDPDVIYREDHLLTCDGVWSNPSLPCPPGEYFEYLLVSPFRGNPIALVILFLFNIFVIGIIWKYFEKKDKKKGSNDQIVKIAE